MTICIPKPVKVSMLMPRENIEENTFIIKQASIAKLGEYA